MCEIKSGLSSEAAARETGCNVGVARTALDAVTIAQLKCQQVPLPAQSNYSGQRFHQVIGIGRVPDRAARSTVTA